MTEDDKAEAREKSTKLLGIELELSELLDDFDKCIQKTSFIRHKIHNVINHHEIEQQAGGD